MVFGCLLPDSFGSHTFVPGTGIAGVANAVAAASDGLDFGAPVFAFPVYLYLLPFLER